LPSFVYGGGVAGYGRRSPVRCVGRKYRPAATYARNLIRDWPLAPTLLNSFLLYAPYLLSSGSIGFANYAACIYPPAATNVALHEGIAVMAAS
jgi:hypothetical protein